MKVYYSDPRLRDLVTKDRALRAMYGSEGARKIGQRLQLLDIAESLDDLMAGPGSCHPLVGPHYKKCYAFRLHGGYRLVFRMMTTEEKAAEGVPDETCALVIEIVDYH